jgi:chemotaxis protein MotB
MIAAKILMNVEETMKYLPLYCAIMMISGCATLNQESYDALMSLPPKVDSLEKKVAHMKEAKPATQIKVEAANMKKQNDSSSKKTAQTLSDSIIKEMNSNQVSVRNSAPRTIQITMQQQVLFHTGSATLNKQGVSFLNKFAHVAKNLPKDAKIRIVGHSDNRQLSWKTKQKFNNNLGLSEARAIAVKNMLIKNGGLAKKMLFAEGRGAAEPIGNNGTRQGRALNRRIEIFIENI